MNYCQLKVKVRELFVYISFFLYCVALFFKRVNLPLDQAVLNKVMTVAALIAVTNIILDFRMGICQIFLTAFVGMFLLVDSLPTGNHELLYLFFLIWSCRNIDNKKIIKFIFGIVLVMTCLVGILTFGGVIENEMVIQNDTRIRYGMGYNVWSILPFQFMSLCMMYFYLSKKKIRIVQMVGLICLSYFIGVVTDTKSSVIITAVGIVCLYLSERIRVKNWKKLRWITLIPVILTLLSLVATYLYSKGIGLFIKLNAISNNRLVYPALGFSRYGVGLLANPDVEVSADPSSYFGIDNNYINLLIVWGVIALIVVLFMYSYIIRYCLENEDIKLLVIVLIMLGTALMWSRLLVLIEAEYLICFSNVFATPTRRKKRICKMAREKY